MNGRIDFLMHKLHPLPDKLRVASYGREVGFYWHSRLWAECDFLRDVSDAEGGRFDELLLSVLEKVYSEFSVGYVSKESCLAAEEALAPAAAACKEYLVHCIGHAHIDMNWMWPFDETVMVTVDTFRTMLRLMEEFPEFTFGQSQASCYRIIEQYGDPEMLEEIKKRVKEGRWEVTASTWVEADKNMPSTESMARHALYTKRYLSKLLDLPKEKLNFDFEPDTFGQSLNVPELMKNAGVKYYYHNRGTLEPVFTRWKSPSGASVLVYRDTCWYNAKINYEFMINALKACNISGQKNILKIYGVGDHGGGPTRRDVSRIIDMMSWPIYPRIKFGTYAGFFEAVDREETKIPESTGERNPVFTGCYTTETLIKQANRMGERVLGEGEMFSAVDTLVTGHSYPAERFADAWEKVLFSQFHDILTGSGVPQTRDYALGTFQEAMALGNTERNRAIRSIASQIDTSAFVVSEDLSDDTAMGAGVGFGTSTDWTQGTRFGPGCFGEGTASNAGGKRRVYTFFNSAPFERTENVEFVIWDWCDRDAALVRFTDLDGNVIRHQFIDGGFNNYWSHNFIKVAMEITVPACGYTSVILSENTDDVVIRTPDQEGVNNRVHYEDRFVLENDLVRVEFDNVDGSIISYFDKETERELCDITRGGGIFRLVREDTTKGMTAWRVGRYKSVEPLTDNVRITWAAGASEPLKKAIRLEIPISEHSRISTVVSLNANSKTLTYKTEVDWHEFAVRGEYMPQLNFLMPLNYRAEEYVYDIPGGVAVRKDYDMDLPGLSFVCARPEEGKEALMLFTDSKYGYRGTDDSMAVTLIRSSYNPDPYPEKGIFSFRICIAPVECTCPSKLLSTAYALNNPFMTVCTEPSKGVLPAKKSFIEKLSGKVQVSGVKLDEETRSALLLRGYETEGSTEEAAFSFFKEVKSAEFVDFNEDGVEYAAPTVEGNTVRFTPAPYSVFTLKLTF